MVKIFMCNDSVEGIFSAIYDAWESRNGHSNNRIRINSEETMELFCEYIFVKEDEVKTEKVIRTVRRKMGEEAYEIVMKAALSCDLKKADLIYRYLILGLQLGRKVTDYLSDYSVRRVFELARSVGNEAHHLFGFVRFRELKDDVLFSRIEPKNQVISILADYFADRLATEKWVILDTRHKTACFYAKECGWFLMNVEERIDMFKNDLSEREKEFESLWKCFFEHIAVRERKNSSLQRQNLPLRFRNDMPEF
jgi:probable DNA metabolism protein